MNETKKRKIYTLFLKKKYEEIIKGMAVEIMNAKPVVPNRGMNRRYMKTFFPTGALTNPQSDSEIENIMLTTIDNIANRINILTNFKISLNDLTAVYAIKSMIIGV